MNYPSILPVLGEANVLNVERTVEGLKPEHVQLLLGWLLLGWLLLLLRWRRWLNNTERLLLLLRVGRLMLDDSMRLLLQLLRRERLLFLDMLMRFL